MSDNDEGIMLWDNEIGEFTMVDHGGANIGINEDFTMVDFQSCTNSDHSNTTTTLSHDEIDLSHELAKIDSSPGSSRLGLRLRKTPSFVSMLERCLNRSAGNYNEGSTSRSTDNNLGSSSHEKLKASNFPALYLQIGDWQRTSRNEGDLVAKLYYAKRKMVWELLDGALKSKIEMQWNDIVGIKIFIGENAMGVLEIELDKPPLYFKETNPQPRKHTLWQLTSDFTNGQAPTWRRHCVRFAPGILDKHIEKLLQYDQRLLELSHKPFPSQLSPYFESNIIPRPNSNISLNFNGYNLPGSPHPYPAYNSTTTGGVTPLLSDMVEQGRNYHQSVSHPQKQIVWDQHNIIGHHDQGPSNLNGYSSTNHHHHQNHWMTFGQDQYCRQGTDHEMNTMNRLLESLDVNTMNNPNNSQMSYHYQQYTNGDYHQQGHGHGHGMQNGAGGITNNNNNNNNSNGLSSGHIDHHHGNWLLITVPPPQDQSMPVLQAVPPPFRQLPDGNFDHFGS